MKLASFGRRILFTGCGALLLFLVSPAPAQKKRAQASKSKPCQGPAELEQVIAKQPGVGPYNALGAFFAKRKELACAVQAFESAVKIDPTSWESRYNLSLALIEKGDPQKASAELKTLIGQKPDLVNARNALGMVLHNLGDLDGAAEQFRAALQHDPKSIYALEHLAAVLSMQKRFTAAIFYLRQAVALEPFQPAHQLALGVALYQNGNTDEAIDVLGKLVQAFPKLLEARYNLATIYAHEKRFKEAADEYAECLKLDPGHHTARATLVKSLLSLDMTADALPHIDEHIRRNPRDFEGYYLLGYAYRLMGRYAEAEPQLRKALELNPDDYDVRYNLGFILARLQNYQEARTHLERAKELRPEATEPRYQLATVLRSLNEPERARQEIQEFDRIKRRGQVAAAAGTNTNQGNQMLEAGDYQRAVEFYRRAIEMEPVNARTFYNLSLALARLGDRAGERDALENAVGIDPNLALAHNQLGLIHMAEGRTGAAERSLKTAIAIDPQFAEAHNNLGVLYGQQGRAQEAEREFRLAVENDPKYAQAYVNLGLALAGAGRFAEAEKEISNAVRLAPQSAGALTSLGMVQARGGKLAASIETFRKVLALQPNSAEAHMNLGIALADGYSLEAALDEFSEAARLAPELPAARYNKGRALFDLRRYEEAKTELEAACRLAPGHADALYLLALAEKQTDNRARSAELLRKVVALRPNDADAHYMLGQNLMNLDQPDEAIAHWRKAVEINPDHGEALYNLARHLSGQDREQARLYQERFVALQKKRQITDRAETLGNFALASAAARDWPGAVAQLKEALEVCGDCRSRADLHKNLGLIYSRSGDLSNGVRELRAALRLKPDDPDLRKALEIVEMVQKQSAGRR